jgi:death-on-curing protein
MNEPIGVPARGVHIIHDSHIARHGGGSGLCDEGLLQNALRRPVKKWQYEDADIFEFTAAYAFGIAKAQAFVEGNKRTEFVTSRVFRLHEKQDLIK